MRILFVAPYVPTLIRVRPYNFVRFLAQNGHALTLATLWEMEQERAALSEFEAFGVKVIAEPLTRNDKLRNLLGTLPSNKPLQASFCWKPELARALSALLSDQTFDAIHVEHLRGARYALHLKSAIENRQSKIPVVWDSVDSITHLFEQAARQSQSAKGKLMTSLELPRTRKYEGWLTEQFDRVLVTSPVDKAALKALTPRPSPISVVPNGVDLNYFSPCNEPREADTLVFSGKMSYHANVTAALYLVNDIMPGIWARKPAVKLWIVGKDPTPDVQALATRHPNNVIVTGSVPDMRTYLRKASVAVVPVVYGAGIQNKVLEAMACGTPVVTSDKTTGSLQPGYEDALRVAKDAESFALSALRLLDDAAERARLSKSGRRYVEAHHDWNVIAGHLASIYQDASRMVAQNAKRKA
jgi:glycosyltransferase involved in cell wall biosynthesis